ncbi:hypothetical protein ILYODFUR_021924, partial [Ilyodon furcidens]
MCWMESVHVGLTGVQVMTERACSRAELGTDQSFWQPAVLLVCVCRVYRNGVSISQPAKLSMSHSLKDGVNQFKMVGLPPPFSHRTSIFFGSFILFLSMPPIWGLRCSFL